MNASIAPEERGFAAVTHLSGLAGYIVPLGGLLVPIVIWIVKKDSPVLSAIARQAILLNLAVWSLLVASWLILMTVLVPLALLVWLILGIAAIALPIIGAVRASDGTYYRYPLIGLAPK